MDRKKDNDKSKGHGKEGGNKNEENIRKNYRNEKTENKEDKHRKTKTRSIKLGTWNIRSINGKEIELSEEFERARLEILVVAETKKKGKGKIEMDNGHLLLWSGVDEKERANAGIGCILHRDIKETVNKWVAVSERIMSIELKNKTSMKTVIAVYGPDEDEKAEKKEKFWDDLNKTMETTRGNIFIAGDFNGRVGIRDHTYTTTIGKYGEEKRNNNGKRLLDFCIIHDLIITNTFFKHKDIHKFTRVQPSRGERSIIDYVLVERENRSIIRDVRVKRSFEIHSDHFLLVAEIRTEGEVAKNNKVVGQRKIYPEVIKSYRLQDKTVASRYKEEINTKLAEEMEIGENADIEEMWKVFKSVITEAAREVCGIIKQNKHKKQTAWWTEEIKQEVKIKKERWQTYLSVKTERSYERYKEQRIKVKNLVKQSKQKTWEDFGNKLERDRKTNQKLFYRVLKNLRGDKKVNSLAITNEAGEILTKETEIMERWKQYFQSLLNEESITEQQINVEQETQQGEQIELNEDQEISKEELTDAIKQLKTGKAPGRDKITTEMVKNMGEEGTVLLLKICNKVWKEEQVPKDWEMGLIIPIHKKGDTKDCSNYRGITLLSTAVKLFEKIIEKRLRKQIEPSLSDTQSGFRKNKCTQDHVFAIKEIINRTLARNRTAYIAFLDMEKAFDRVPRAKIWEILNKKKVDTKLIRVTKCLYKTTRNCVISKNMISEEFVTKEGVRQGGSLSPLLFITFMDELIKKTQGLVKPMFLGYRNLESINVSEYAFADDIAIIARSEKDLEENINIWNKVLTENGMRLNKNKSKVMTINEERKEIHIRVERELLEQVDSFQYLGIILDQKGRQDTELNNRIKKANRAYYAMSKCLINKKEVSPQTKMKVYKSIYRPILTYGCESWVLSTKDKSKIRATEMKYLRRARGVTKLDRMRNEQIRTDLNIESVEEYIEQRQLGWWGHLQRLSNTALVKRIWESKPPWKKKRGRPKETWDNTIGKILKKKEKTWTEAKKLAQNRKDWKKFIKN